MKLAAFYYCTVCEQHAEFTDFSGRERVQCTGCGSLERHRKQALYLHRFTDVLTGARPIRVLHVAPEQCFSALLRNRPNITYVAADLNPRNRGGSAKNPIIPADLCALPFDDESFDVIICSHVLEHIPADDDAMDELHRVLAPDGVAILDVPLRHAASTYEDWSITSDEGRTAAFGQYDHVRFYGGDYFTKLGHAGLDATELDNFWDDLDGRESQLGNWGIIVAQRSTPTLPSERPPHNRPVYGTPVLEKGTPAVPQQSVDVAPADEPSLPGVRDQFWAEYGHRDENGDWILDVRQAELTPDDAFLNASEFAECSSVSVLGAEHPAGHAIALAIAAARNASLLVEPDGSGGAVARLSIAKDAEWPSPIASPSRPARMPAELPVEAPRAAGNDFTYLVSSARVGPMPTAPVSVVIPVYNRKEMLRRTLACLTHQTYPGELIEIVIADDGSSDSPDSLVAEFSGHFGAVRYVRQPDEGYRLSEVRNLGLQAARHDYMILLDCDMAPVPRMVELYARHLEAEPRAVYCGHRRYVDANDVNPSDVLASIEPMLALADIRPDNSQVTEAEQAGPTIDWRVPIYQETDGLRFERHPFRAVCGGNIGFTKELFAVTGGFDVDFRAWGGEDAEWGYRAWNRGFYVVPLIDACGLHMEPRGGRNETDREAGRAKTHPLLIDRCPVRYRPSGGTDRYKVPLVSIYIPAYNARETIVTAIRSALRQSIEDLEVCVVDDGSTDGTYERVQERFGQNPRVRIARQENGGIGSASNAAMRMCRAPFIGQLDADDRIKQRAVAKLLAVMRSDPRIGVVYSSSELIDKDGERVGDSYEFPHYSRSALLYGMIIHHFRLCRARDWYRTSGFATDITNAVDYDMYLKLAEVTEMVHVPKQLYQYRKHDSSTSQAQHGIQRANHRLAVERAIRRRGLSGEWELQPRQPVDSREYEFEAAADATHYGATVDLVRISIDVGWQRDDGKERLQALFPTWNVELRRRLGRPRIESPLLSHARAIRSLPAVSAQFPDASVRIVHGGV